jgi:hypothetical protein
VCYYKDPTNQHPHTHTHTHTHAHAHRYPSPPLDLVFSICDSIHAWLSADPSNVCVVHCQTGNGRTVAVVAAYLAWSRMAREGIDQALAYIAKKRKAKLATLVIPTQIRYSQYFAQVCVCVCVWLLPYVRRYAYICIYIYTCVCVLVCIWFPISVRACMYVYLQLLQGVKPKTRPLRLLRVIMNGIPTFEDSGHRIRPYMQIFKSSKLVYSSTLKEQPGSQGRSTGELQSTQPPPSTPSSEATRAPSDSVGESVGQASDGKTSAAELLDAHAPSPSPSTATADAEPPNTATTEPPHTQVARKPEREKVELKWYDASDGSILFPVNLVLEGDILVRL